MKLVKQETTATKFQEGLWYELIRDKESFKGVFIGYDSEHDGEVKLAGFQTHTRKVWIDMDFFNDKYYKIFEK